MTEEKVASEKKYLDDFEARLKEDHQQATARFEAIETHMAEERTRRELGEKLWRVLYPKDGDK